MNSLNHFYRLVWNHSQRCWQAVGELAKAQGKASGRAARPNSGGAILLRRLIAVTALASAISSQAAPLQGQIQQGLGQISHSGLTTTINQQSQRLDVNWQSFDVKANETVNFVQPGRESLAVNHILDTNGSRIQGQINANGQVWLINPNGVAFGKQAQVNVGGLVASTLQEQSNSGEKVVFGTGLGGFGSVSNEGNITTAAGGYVAFIGEQTSNQGDINSAGGSVVMGAGSQVSLTFAGSQLVNLNVEQSTLDNLADNQGLIQAEGGQVLMSAGARDSLLASVVNNDGVITANSVVKQDGKIILLAGMQAGTTYVAGTLDASAKTGDSQAQGGFIETSAHTVTINPSSHITTYAANGQFGTWLIDPKDYTIGIGGDMLGFVLSTILETTSIEIKTTDGSNGVDGNIYVNDIVSWHAGSTLTLNAKGDIHINANIATETGKVSLIYGQAQIAAGNTADYYLNGGKIFLFKAGKNFSTQLGNDGPLIEYQVITELGAEGSTTGRDLQGMQNKYSQSNQPVLLKDNQSGNYVLGVDINVEDSNQWNGGRGFEAIGSKGGANELDKYSFSGHLSGLGHTVTNLAIGSLSNSNLGLFGYIRNATIRDVGVTGTVRGSYNIGGLVGQSSNSNISNSYADVTVMGKSTLGGLVGLSSETVISNSYATGEILAWNAGTTGASTVGGLVGELVDGEINNSYSSINVEGHNSVGGLVGENGGNILNSYATGEVKNSGDTTASNFGGLVGRNTQLATIKQSYASGNVLAEGAKRVGGLVGNNGDETNSYLGGTISDSYATGIVKGADYVGGLLGSSYSDQNLDITNSYAKGHVTGQNYVGGLVGQSDDGIKSSYATGKVTGNNFVGGLLGQLSDGDIEQSYATGAVTGSTQVGGLIGQVAATYSSVRNSNATGSVTGTGTSIGGLIGNFLGSYIEQSYATGKIAAEDSDNVGGLVGRASNASISLSYATGKVTGRDFVGGLIGNGATSLASSYATGKVTGRDNIGGLAGIISKPANRSVATTQVYATGDVIGRNHVGGLIGTSNTDTSKSYTTGEVTGTDYVGGVVGVSNDDIRQSYTTGSVTGSNYVGGIAGYLTKTISETYAAGTVTGVNTVGGLVGGVGYPGEVRSSYAFGSVLSGGDKVGGLVGSSSAADSVSFSSWDISKTGQTTSAGGGVGKAVINSKEEASFGVWSFGTNGTWRIYEGNTMPLLRTFLTSKNLDIGTTTVVYDGNDHRPAIVDSDSLLLAAAGAFTNAGVHTAAGSIFSHQQGYDIIGAGKVTITPASLTVTGSRVYDGSKIFAAGDVSVTGWVNGESLSGDITATASDAAVYSFGDLALAADDSNYQLTSGSVEITPRNITLNGSREYNGSSTVNLEDLTISNVVSGDQFSGQFTLTGSDVNTYTVSGVDLGNNNYQLAASGNTVTITPASLTVSGSRVYDGSNIFNASNFSINGLVSGENLSGDITATASDVAVYSVGDLTLAAGNSNYTVASGSLAITQADLTVSGTRVYDGSKTFAASDVTVTGWVNNESLSGDITATASDAAVYSFADLALAASDSNYKLTSGSLAITQASLTVSGTRAYDGSKTFGAGDATVTGWVNNESLSGDITATASDAAVYSFGNLALAAGDSNYKLTSGSLVITQAGLIVSGTRAYDGSNTFAAANLIINGLADAETLIGDITVASNNAGNYSGPELTLASGNSNYQLQSGSLDITPRSITLSGSREYNGSSTIDLEDLIISNVVQGEQLSGQFALAGSDADTYTVSNISLANNNYQLAASGNTVTITPASLTVSGSRVYDGSNVFNASNFSINGLIGGESLNGDIATTASDAALYSFSDLALAAGDSNYKLTSGSLAITQASLTVSGSRVYDGSNTFAAGDVSVTGWVNNENLSGDITATASDAAAYSFADLALAASDSNYKLTSGSLAITQASLTVSGTRAYDGSKTFGADDVTVTGWVNNESLIGDITVSNSDVGNYSGADLSLASGNSNYQLTSGSLDIIQAELTVSGTRQYDGGDAFTANDVVTGLVAGESLTGDITVSASNVGNYSGADLTLAEGNSNYQLTSGTLDISPRSITLTGSRAYDGSNAINLGSLSVSNLVAGDALAGEFTVSGSDVDTYQIGSVNLGNNNYQLSASGNEVSIVARTVTLNGSREYDGSNSVNFENLTVDNLVAGDALIGEFNLANSDVGSYQLDDVNLGNGNYQLAASGSAVSITPRNLTVTGSREYNGNGSFNAIDLSNVTGLIAGDSLAGVIILEASNVGDYSAAGLALADGNANYQLESGRLVITPRSITLNGSRAYDGSNLVNLASLTATNLVAGDSLSGEVTITGQDVGSYSLNGFDLGNANYQTTGSGSAVTIVARQVQVQGSRIYDGSTDVDISGLSLSNVVEGEALSLLGSATAASKNVGEQTLLVEQLSLNSNGGALNYSLDDGGHNITITPLPIDAQVSASDKTFDANLEAELASIGSAGVLAGDEVAFNYASALFAELEGVDLTVEVNGINLTGADGANYLLRDNQAITTASVFPLQGLDLTAAINILQGGGSKTSAAPANSVPTGSAQVNFSNLDATESGGINCLGFAAGGSQGSEEETRWSEETGVSITQGGVNLGGGCSANTVSML